jgi:hypothetical protein
METIVTRSVAGAGLALALAFGGWVGARLTLETADAVDIALARRIDPDQAQRAALQQKASYEDSEEYYQIGIDDAVERYKITAPPRERLLEPNTFFHVASSGDTRLLAPGASLSQAGLDIRINVEDIDVERRGIRTKNTHTLAMVRNVGDKPLAYFLQLRSRTGDCQLRALTRYDAMVLMPDEEAEISVCSGSHEVEITDLRVLEVTELGALWVSKLPPQAVGHDDVSGRSHHPGAGIDVCAEMPALDFSTRIKDGEAEWEDIVDFYSRHDCDHYRWWPGYKRIVEPLTRLPALPEAAAKTAPQDVPAAG